MAKRPEWWKIESEEQKKGKEGAWNGDKDGRENRGWVRVEDGRVAWGMTCLCLSLRKKKKKSDREEHDLGHYPYLKHASVRQKARMQRFMKQLHHRWLSPVCVSVSVYESNGLIIGWWCILVVKLLNDAFRQHTHTWWENISVWTGPT